MLPFLAGAFASCVVLAGLEFSGVEVAVRFLPFRAPAPQGAPLRVQRRPRRRASSATPTSSPPSSSRASETKESVTPPSSRRSSARSLVLPRSSQGLAYFKVPKTGSTLLMRAFKRACKKDDKLIIHDHGGGCRQDGNPIVSCNASFFEKRFPSIPSIAVLRDPCDRLTSQWAHMKVMDARTFGRLKDPAALLDWIEEAMNGSCPLHSTDCLVRQINAKYRPNHRVILYPQSYFIAQRTRIVCFRQYNFTSLLNQEFQPQCPRLNLVSNARVNVRSHKRFDNSTTCQRIDKIYPEDTRLFRTHCAHL
jgi:hypothetical protein